MSHRACLVFLSAPPWTSCHPRCCRLTASLAPNWASQVPLRPLTHGDPISLRVHTLLLPPVRYNNKVCCSRSHEPNHNKVWCSSSLEPNHNKVCCSRSHEPNHHRTFIAQLQALSLLYMYTWLGVSDLWVYSLWDVQLRQV